MMTTPDPDAFLVPITEIKPWDRNPRDNSAAAEKLEEVIHLYGWGDAILLQRGTNRILAGHTRLKAAKKLGYTEVPVRYLDIHDPNEAAAFTVVHNRTSEFAAWDHDELDLICEDFDLDMSLDLMFDPPEPSDSDFEDAPRVEAPPSDETSVDFREECGRCLITGGRHFPKSQKDVRVEIRPSENGITDAWLYLFTEAREENFSVHFHFYSSAEAATFHMSLSEV